LWLISRRWRWRPPTNSVIRSMLMHPDPAGRRSSPVESGLGRRAPGSPEAWTSGCSGLWRRRAVY
jgi:hypothetical protein